MTVLQPEWRHYKEKDNEQNCCFCEQGENSMNEKLDARTKWSYCIGATGRDAAYALVSMYLILYVQYTMNLTSAQFAVISAAMVVCMIWDAVNDLPWESLLKIHILKWENSNRGFNWMHQQCDCNRLFSYNPSERMGICLFLQSFLSFVGDDLHYE